MRVFLTREEIDVLISSLSAHFAGDTSVGDLSWTDAQHDAADAALGKLVRALRRKDAAHPPRVFCPDCHAAPGSLHERGCPLEYPPANR
jgi:hypothetical protein